MAYTINGNLLLKGFGQIKNLRVENVTADPATPQEGQFWMNTTDKVFRGYVDSKIINFASGDNLQVVETKLAAVIAAIGLNADGSFSAPAGANYIAAATSVFDAVEKLDAALKVSADALAAEITRAQTAEAAASKAAADEATRATAAEGTLQTNLEAEVTRAQAAEKVNADAIAAEILRATAAEQAAAKAAADEATRATAAEGALDTRVIAIEGSYVKKDGSVAFIGDQSMGGYKLTHVADAIDDADAVNKKYVDGKIGSLGNAFNYVATVDGGVDEAHAFDLSTLPAGGKDTGDYYKVATAGWFKGNATATAFYAELHDGLVKNTEVDGWDKFAHADTVVIGTTNEIVVTGTIDTGFTVSISPVFTSRVSTLETGLAAEITRATTAEGTLTTNLAAEATRATTAEGTLTTNLEAEVTRATTAEGTLTTNLAAEATRATGAEGTLTTNLAAEVTRATGAEGALQTELDAAEASVGLTADGALPVLTGTYIAAASSIVDAAQKLDVAIKAVADAAGASSFLYEASAAATSHVVLHNLGQKYVAYTITDSDDNAIGVDGVHFDSANQLTVTLLSAQTIRVFVKR